MRWTQFGRYLLPLALATGCEAGSDGEGDSDGVSRLKQALPSAEEMTLTLPSAAALSPEPATFYGFTRGVTLSVNGFVWAITHVIEDVVEQPPTETDGETFAVWGPYHDPLSPATWRVRVDAAGEGIFDFRVEGWPKDADAGSAVTVLSGRHDEAGVEQGTWTYDMTAAHALDAIAHDSTGEVSVAYADGDPRTLEVRFVDVQGPRDPMATSALYRYTEAADGTGALDFISNLDLHADDDPNLNRRELLQVRSRWLATGPGRTDAVATHGDLPAGQAVDVVECWDESFQRSYIAFGYADLAQVDGDPESCAFAAREVPTFDDFDPDAFADGDLVEALPEPVDVAEVPAPVADPVAQPAAQYVLAQQTIAGLVIHVRAVLELVRVVTHYPPSDCTPEGCTWGPYTDWETQASFRLEVTREGDDRYAFRGESKRFGAADDAWRTSIEGGFHRVQGDDGDGWLVLDLDAVAAANPAERGGGRLRAEWSRDGDHRQLGVRLDDFLTDDHPDRIHARYFVETDANGGHLDLRFPANVDDDPAKAAAEQIESRIRWQPDGAGTGNARVFGGDIAEGYAALGVECWDQRAAVTHTNTVVRAPGQDTTPEIDAEACVFDDFQGPELPPMQDE